MAATTTESATATSTTSDGPVLTVITKRLRALRKKLNRIHHMEDSLSQGKSLNSEQLEVLRSKPSVLTLIDELEKLRAPLSAALEEELSLALSHSSEPPRNDTTTTTTTNNNNDNNNNDEIEVEDEDENGKEKEKDDDDEVEGVEDVLKLMYFGSLFDVKQQSEFTSLMLTRTHERGCCLTYDYVSDDATDLLVEKDLDLISALQGLIISRPADSGLSHRNALEQCVQHAKLWLRNSEQPIHPDSSVTYAALREKLNKIMASDYFTATPQMKGPGEVAAAAAVGNFGSFQVPVQESVVQVEVPVHVEGSPEQYQETEENMANHEEYETVEHQSGNIDEFQKEELESENPPEAVPVHTDQDQFHNAEAEHGYRSTDYKDQQYVPRRGQRGGRGGGGGRRGYSNGRGGRGTGRGGGPYQNGRSQYYDNYYPRNNHYSRRGGRGNGGGGNSYYNHSSGAAGNHSEANIGVAS